MTALPELTPATPENAPEDALLAGQLLPETQMWRRVILQLLLDATWIDPRPDDDITRANRDGFRRQMRTARAEAIVWFRGTSQDFRTVCDYAGMDPERVHAIASRFMSACGANRSIRDALVCKMNGSDPFEDAEGAPSDAGLVTQNDLSLNLRPEHRGSWGRSRERRPSYVDGSGIYPTGPSSFDPA